MQEILNDNEREVYEIVKDFLKQKNKPIEKEIVLAYVISNTSDGNNLNKRGIERILNSLLKKKLIIEGSSLTKEEVINLPKRKKILRYIEENPGTYLFEIVKNLNTPIHVTIWHLNVLIDFDLIKKGKIFNHEIYYDAKISYEQAELDHFMRNEKCKLILTQIERSIEGISKTSLAKQLKMHPSTVKKYISALERINLILKIKEANKNLYTLNRI